MKEFRIVPKIIQCSSMKEFLKEFKPGSRDLVFTSRSVYETYLVDQTEGAHVIFSKDYGNGEPSDDMVESIYHDIKDINYERIIAIGGGTILDVAKLLALKQYIPVLDLFEGRMEAVRNKALVLVPSSCGTGSEVTNISVLELISRRTKMGLAAEALYGDYAVLIPELLTSLPMRYFASSSIDALVHAMEAYTSPRANSFTRSYSMQAIKLILTGYRRMELHGKEARFACLGSFLTASTYAGIAFGNAGCAAVHAMSYPLSGAYHVPHGEANYAFFIKVFRTYQKLKPEGRLLSELNQYLSKLLGCYPSEVFEALEKLLETILPLRALHEYGMRRADIEEFTETVMLKQTRLMKNSYTALDWETVKGIYQELF